MAQATSLEAIIEIASTMKEYLEGLLQAYSELVPVIDEEHAAISNVGFEELSKIGARKAAIGEKIEKLHGQLRVKKDSLTNMHAGICGRRAQKVSAISDCIVLFKEIKSESEEDVFGGQVLDHVVAKLKKLTEDFQKDVAKLKPKIDMNKYLLDKLINNYRDSYRFWQEIAAATVSPYNAKGVQQAKTARSSLQVKA